MSTSPSYYSGRGATTTDLDDASLEKIWTAIKTHQGAEAAQAFVLMVESIPVLSATDFLITLSTLEQNDFRWDARDEKHASKGGIDITRKDDGSYDGVSVFCTAMSMFGGSGRRDDTWAIRSAFLARHGRKPKSPENSRHYGPFGY